LLLATIFATLVLAAEGRQELVGLLGLAVAERDLSSDLAEARRSKASALRLKLMFFLDFFFRLVLLLATLIGSISGSSSSEVSSSSRAVGRSENPRGTVVMWWG
jgi:hypothetical protein